jgi:hypothetical protein
MYSYVNNSSKDDLWKGLHNLVLRERLRVYANTCANLTFSKRRQSASAPQKSVVDDRIAKGHSTTEGKKTGTDAAIRQDP